MQTGCSRLQRPHPVEERPGSARTRQRYDRIAPLYDRLVAIPERLAIRRWREMLWDRVEGPHILEIGVGTGKNLPYYPPGASVVATDLSPKMIERDRRRAEEQAIAVNLQVADVQRLPFPDQAFDSVASTFVFCSVPRPEPGAP